MSGGLWEIKLYVWLQEIPLPSQGKSSGILWGMKGWEGEFQNQLFEWKVSQTKNPSMRGL